MKIHRQPLDNCVHAPVEFCCPCFMYLHIWMLENLKHRITLIMPLSSSYSFKNKLSFHNYKEYFFYIVFIHLIISAQRKFTTYCVFLYIYMCIYVCMCMYMYTYIAFKKIYLLIYFAAPGLRCSMSI